MDAAPRTLHPRGLTTRRARSGRWLVDLIDPDRFVLGVRCIGGGSESLASVAHRAFTLRLVQRQHFGG